METIIKVILLFGLLIICLLGFMYFIVCLSSGRNRGRGFEMLARTTQEHIPRKKPTIPPKEGWDDINIPMR